MPFCRSKCIFCPFYTEKSIDFEEGCFAEYYKCVQTELISYSKTKLCKNANVSSVYFGGGDPACVNIQYIIQTLNTIKKFYDISECTEITVEGNVISLLEDSKLEQLKAEGVTKVSFGIQTFNKDIRKKLALRPTVNDIYSLVERIKAVGFEKFSVDIMYNLPDETMEDLYADILDAKKLGASSIDFYSLSILPNTKMATLINNPFYCTNPPKSDKAVQMSKIILNEFKNSEYTQYSSMCFTKSENKVDENSLCMTNVGVGASAKGYFDGYCTKNFTNISEYIAAITQENMGVQFGYLIQEEEKLEKEMIYAISLVRFSSKKLKSFVRFENIIKELIADGYMKEDNEYLELTDEGLTYIGNIQNLFVGERQKNRKLVALYKSKLQNKNPYNQDNTNT